jgi:hypothetical protein
MTPRYRTIALALVLTASAFSTGWWMRQNSSGIAKSKDAFFMHLEDNSIECFLRPSFMTRLFGANWREQDIYVSFRGWTSSGSESIVESDLAPKRSLSLDYSWRVPIPPSGNRWDVEVELYSRTTKKCYNLVIGMKSHKVVIAHEAVLSNMREIVRPSGFLAIRPVSGPGSEIP